MARIFTLCVNLTTTNQGFPLTLLSAGGGGSKDPPALFAIDLPFTMKFHELKHVDFYSMSFVFDLIFLAFYVLLLIFGSPFLAVVKLPFPLEVQKPILQGL